MTVLQRLEVPREDLIRMTTSVRAEDDGNLLVGYAAVFNDWTEINSWEGQFKERIAPGAFRKTLRERGDQVKVLFNHGMDPSIGDKPLGKPRSMKERDKGLYVEVPLDDTSYNADIKALLRSGALDGMSFRMSVLAEEWNLPEEGLPERTIKEIRLYEFGPVTFPAYQATEAGVRAHAPRAFEAWRNATNTPATLPDEEERHEDPPADADVTDGEGEPEIQSTRSEDQGDPPTYQPAQRSPMTPERRQAQMGTVRAFLAQTTKE
jgi:HK97 family phage prohead protease